MERSRASAPAKCGGERRRNARRHRSRRASVASARSREGSCAAGTVRRAAIRVSDDDGGVADW
uniref:Uncharacterized protein n=1 Tax=Arundo donax TaxID=35708 RepID=A0A0A8YZQ6_ARUDO